MPNSRGRFGAVVGAGWLLLALGAWIYARVKSTPEWAALPIAAAFLIEFPFYLSPAFAGPRAWLARRSKSNAAGLLAASAIAPYLVYSIGTGTAGLTPFLMLLLIAVVIAFWYIILPVTAATDALFLCFVAAVMLSKVFKTIFLPAIPRLDISVLGHVMLIRTGALAILTFRGNAGAEFRFIPSRHEWITGLRYFAMMLPPAALGYWALGLVKLRPHPLNPLFAVGIFFVVLWVLALSEEFFFRGLLQQWMERWTRHPLMALILASVIFGSAHLSFHGRFPNWRWAIVASIVGLFCGLAWRSARSIQASMVTHALVVTLWEVFFQ